MRMPSKADLTADAATVEVEVKQEVEYVEGQPPSCRLTSPAIKAEITDDVAGPFEGADPTGDVRVKTEPYDASAAELVEGFVIYELQAPASLPPPPPPPTTTTTVITKPQTEVAINHSPRTPRTPPPPPTLLNAKLRKRPRGRGPSSSGSPDGPPQAAIRISRTSAAAAAPVAEVLKVKCFCRLGKASDSGEGTAGDRLELKQFYERMFEETRKLSPGQQRTVKMALLRAVCEAEDAAEAGKCCQRCCP